MKMTVETTGVPETLIRLKLLDTVVRKTVEQSVKRGAIGIEKRAKENISGEHGHVRHVKTGNLRRSIQSKVGWKNFVEIVGVIGTDVPYAPHVEALPDGGFLYPALREVGSAIARQIKTDMSFAIRGVAR